MEVYVMVVMGGAESEQDIRPESPDSVRVFSTQKAAQRRVCESIIKHLSGLTLYADQNKSWKFHVDLCANIYLSWSTPGETSDQDALDDQYQKVMNVYNDAPDYLVKTNPSFWIHKRTVKEA